MTTVKTRLNITLSDDMRDLLMKIAKRDRVPQATKAVSLLESALEIEEDQFWNQLAMKRDKKNARYITHDKAWG